MNTFSRVYTRTDADPRDRDHGMYDLRCISFLGKDNSEILVAGCQNTMFKIDVEKGRVTEEVDDVTTLSDAD